MNQFKKNLPIYVLSASLVFSSIIYANQAQSAPKYATEKQLMSLLQATGDEIGKLQARVNWMEKCLKKGLYVNGRYANC